MSNYTRFPETSGGIKIYPSATFFPANPGKDGVQAVAADTNTIYIFDTTTSTWVAVATPGAAIAIDALIDDVTATGPGVASATVNSVGGAAAADIASATADVLAATDLSTPSTLMKRDGSGETSLDGLNLDGSTSGYVKMQAAATTTSYTVKMPAAQGLASTFLQNDGSGNLTWVDPLPSQSSNDDKVLVTDGTSVSWQYAGLGSGSYGTNNVFLGRGKPSGLTTGTYNTLAGASAGNGLTSGLGNVAIGSGAGAGLATGDLNIVIGRDAGNTSAHVACVIVGDSALVNTANPSTYSVAIGRNVGAFNVQTESVMIGDAAADTSTQTRSVIIGRAANLATSSSDSVVLGNRSSSGGLDNVFALGSNSSPINTMYLGKGADFQATANAVKVQTQRAAGTNIDLSAGTLTLAGSQSTGNKAGGDVILSAAPAGSSGSSLNAHVEIMRAKATKEAKFSGGLIVKTLHGQTGTANVITVAVEDYYVGIDCSLASKTVNLPAASSVEAGKMYVIKDESGDATTNPISIVADGTDLIDGSGTDSLVVDYESVTLVCNGVNEWYVI